MKKFTIFAATLLLILSCSQQPHTKKIIQEDRAAKRMLQGIWINEDGEDVAFRVKGDTIFYPDTTSLPVYFQIIDDTLVLHGAKEAKYHIQKQAEHLFVFENQSGEHITLTKSEDASDIYYSAAANHCAQPATAYQARQCHQGWRTPVPLLCAGKPYNV